MSSSAYEIAKWWHETPPPPEIVEYLTAKGGNLRSRRLEDFQGRDGDGVDGIGVDEPPSTPNQESVEQDEPGSATRYPKRKSLRSTCVEQLHYGVVWRTVELDVLMIFHRT